MDDVAGNWHNAYAEALKNFKEQGQPKKMAENSGAQYQGNNEQGCFLLRYCGDDYTVTYPDGLITCGSGKETVPVSVRVSLLLYMVHAVPLPDREDWKTFKDLPQGYHHWAPFWKEGLTPLVKAFGNDLAAFRDAAEKLAGTPVPLGDAGYQFRVLPRVPLRVLLWEGDQEFPPNANILYNGTCVMQLDTATLYMLGIDLCRRLLYRAGKLNRS